MKNVFKILGIISLVAVIGFSMAACGGGDDTPVIFPVIPPIDGGGDVQTFTGTVTAFAAPDSSGKVEFRFTGKLGTSGSDTCIFTTNLPAPNNTFTEESYYFTKTIDGLTDGQEVTWTATVTALYGHTYHKSEGGYSVLITYD